MSTITPKRPGWVSSLLVYILLALFPAFWFFRQPAKLMGYFFLQAFIIAYAVVYPFIGTPIVISYMLLIHTLRNKI
jgi:hypothetical protein